MRHIAVPPRPAGTGWGSLVSALNEAVGAAAALRSAGRFVLRSGYDWFACDLVSADATVRRAVFTHRDATANRSIGTIARLSPDDGALPLTIPARTTRRPSLQQLPPKVGPASALADAIHDLRVRDWVTAPIIRHGRLIGALACGISPSGPDAAALHLPFGRTLADHLALALAATAGAAHTDRDDVAHVVHDMRGPLAAIDYSATALAAILGHRDDHPSTKLIAGIQRSAAAIAALADELVPTSAAAPRARSAPGTLVAAAAARAEPLAVRAHIELVRQVDTGLPDVVVDPARIARVFDNLVANALRYTPRGGCVTLQASGHGNQVCFRVIDTGCGISADHGRLLDAETPARRRTDGHGLGLTICRQIVADHHGQMWIDPPPAAGGASVAFTIPIVVGT